MSQPVMEVPLPALPAGEPDGPSPSDGAPAPREHRPARRALSGTRKAAILMVSLGDQISAEILRKLSEQEVQRVTREIARIGTVTSEEADVVLEEFYQMIVAREYAIRGGLEYAERLLTSAFGSETARELVERLGRSMATDSTALDALQKADPQQLANFIQGEHPQTIALLLSHLPGPRAAALLTSLPAELRADIAVRMAHLDHISPEIVHRIVSVIGQKLESLGEVSRESYGGVRAVAEMFNRLDTSSSKEVLDAIEQQNSEVAESIRRLMFVFEDLLKVDSSGIKEILGRVDRKVLTTALKGTSEPLKDHFLKSMSHRGAEMLVEDIEALGPVRIKDVEAAQQQVIAVARQLEADGVLSLHGGGGDQYVV